MRVLRTVTIAAIVVGFSSAAMAGGFSFKSKGQNHGDWAYGNARASGDAIVKFGKTGKTRSEDYASTYTYKGDGTYKFKQEGNKKYDNQDRVWYTGSDSASGNRSSFESTYGMGSAQSHSSSTAGSGIGNGSGEKSGYFKPYAPRKPRCYSSCN